MLEQVVKEIGVDEDGVIIGYNETITTLRRTKNYDEFIMVYLQDMSSFLRLENATQIKVLTLIWRDIVYNDPLKNEGNIITILKEDKEKWAEEIGISLKTVNTAIAVLKDKDLLELVSRSRYRLNPKYFFKGASNDRKKILKKEFIYEIEPNADFE